MLDGCLMYGNERSRLYLHPPDMQRENPHPDLFFMFLQYGLNDCNPLSNVAAKEWFVGLAMGALQWDLL